MNSDPNSSPETSALVETPETLAIVETDDSESEDIRQETLALIEAIKQRAKTEVQSTEDLAKSASDFARQTYLNTIRQVREAVEQNRLVDPNQIEQSAQQLQQDAEKNWQALVLEVTALSDRLSEAAKAAWDKLVEPSHKDAP